MKYFTVTAKMPMEDDNYEYWKKNLCNNSEELTIEKALNYLYIQPPVFCKDASILEAKFTDEHGTLIATRLPEYRPERVNALVDKFLNCPVDKEGFIRELGKLFKAQFTEEYRQEFNGRP